MARARLEPGEVLDGFTLGEKLHTGGMATLWSVTHPDHALPLLMKLPKLAEGQDAAAIVSFEMEQMILPRLSGPHVPRFVAAADFSVQPYLVMERVPGASLLGRLDHLPLPVEEVARIGARVAEALDALHRQHVVHLDIKPSNVMFREKNEGGGGEAVLIDFGLSHHAQLPDLMEEEFRLPYGTAPYMAPEQVLGERSEPRSDLFALGAMLSFFTTGTRPFGDPQRLSGLKRRLWDDPVPPRKLRPDCPPWLQEIILRCLEVQPDRRHASAAQLAFDLRHPDQIALSARAQKTRRDPWSARIKRRFNPDTPPPGPRRRDVAGSAAAVPIVAVAVDLDTGGEAQSAAMRETLGRVLAMLPGARLACLNVLRTNLITPDSTLDAEGRNKHALRLAQLKHWAAPLALEEGRATFHVLEALNPAEALLSYAEANRIDHLVMGAREQSLRRRVLGSVSGEVAANAPCSVTVVRARGGD